MNLDTTRLLRESTSLQALQLPPHHLKYRIFAPVNNCKKECSFHEYYTIEGNPSSEDFVQSGPAF